MLVKTRYQNIFFFSFISLQFINNTSFTLVFLYKRLQKEKESLEVIARKRKGMQMDYVDGFNKKSYKGRCRARTREAVKWAEVETQTKEIVGMKINNVMDVIRACVAEMQRLLMGSLDSRLHPTKWVGFSNFLYRPTVEASIWKCFESSSGEYALLFLVVFFKRGQLNLHGMLYVIQLSSQPKKKRKKTPDKQTNH